jgi:hypothetical protein
MHEVPLPQRPFLALDDQERLAGEHEEVLLTGFPVVHPDRLARPEDEQVDPDLREVRLGFEVRPTCERQALPSPLAVPPAPSRVFRTNHPSPTGASPASVCSSAASGTMAG